MGDCCRRGPYDQFFRVDLGDRSAGNTADVYGFDTPTNTPASGDRELAGETAETG